MDDLIECPRCGFEQPRSPSCVSCGIIFAKYKKTAQPATQIYMSAVSDEQVEGWSAGQQQPASGAPAPAQGDDYGWRAGGGLDPWADPAEYSHHSDSYNVEGGVSHDYFEEPGQDWQGAAGGYATDDSHIDAEDAPVDGGPTAYGGRPEVVEPPPADYDYAPPTPHSSRRRESASKKATKPAEAMPMAGRILRGALAVAALAGALMLVTFGRAFDAAVPFAATVLLTGWALWGLTTVRRPVAAKQFGIELAVLVVGTGGLFAADTGLFSFEDAAPKFKDIEIKVAEPVLPDTPLGGFTEAALAYTTQLAAVIGLEEPAGYEFWDRVDRALDWDKLRSRHHLLPEDDKARSIKIMDAFKTLGPAVNDAMKAYRAPAGAGYRFEAPQETRDELDRLRADAWSEVNRLKMLIQIIPARDEGAAGKGPGEG